ncbi:MAG TPA: hypothetical protein VG936_03435 [Lacunisphaera sp.]|nr:hypothetical protein [Lacunisphaera sp.]
MGCTHILVAVFLAVGLALLYGAATRHRHDQEQLTPPVVIQGLAGLVAVIGSGVYLRIARRLVRDAEAEEVRRTAHPDEPWLWKKKWMDGVIEADGRVGVAMLWVMTVFWNGISWPVMLAAFSKPHHDNAVFFVLLFPLVGLGLLVGAVYQTIRWRKFGRPRFLMSRLPGAIGGYVGGMIEVPARVTPEADLRLTLRNIRREVTGSGKNRSVRETVLWEHEERIAPDKLVSGPGRTEAPVLFYVPDTGVPTDDADANNEVLWRLEARAAVPGVDFAATFTVPVFRTGETAAPPEPDKPLHEDYRAGPPDGARLHEAGVKRDAGSWIFTASHLWGSRLVFTLVTAILAGLGVFLLGRGVPFVVWVVLGLFGAIFFFGAADLWLSRFELRLQGDEVVVRHTRWSGTQERRVARRDVVRVGTAKSMTIGTTQYYRLELAGADGPGGGADAPFAARKLDFLIRQAQARGLAEDSPELRALREQWSHQPKFTVPFAKHVPGPELAQRIAEMVMVEINGK